MEEGIDVIEEREKKNSGKGNYQDHWRKDSSTEWRGRERSTRSEELRR